MSDFVMLGGERFLRLEVVARWYRIEISFIEEAVELGLLPAESTTDSDRVLAEHALDRLAQLLRWHWQTGLDLATLALLLPTETGFP